jgi:hypothetical protein
MLIMAIVIEILTEFMVVNLIIDYLSVTDQKQRNRKSTFAVLNVQVTITMKLV